MTMPYSKTSLFSRKVNSTVQYCKGIYSQQYRILNITLYTRGSANFSDETNNWIVVNSVLSLEVGWSIIYLLLGLVVGLKVNWIKDRAV